MAHFRRMLLPMLLGAVALPLQAVPTQPAAHGAYRNFRTAIYVTVSDVKRLADPAAFARDFGRVSSQLKFDKVYIEAYRDNLFATDAELAAVKQAFEAKGIETAGGVTLAAGGSGGQFGSFDYEKPQDRAECERAVRLAARHFDTVILDDFFFFNRKSDADIAAKGKRSWTEYRMAAMRNAARDLVIGPARAENPRVKVIIKYPNWYEHFHGLGFDLAAEPQIFDGIYTGTETRDPEITDQLLQQYESYEVLRYFSNIAPGRNGGGWVDTYDTRYVDRYAEQLWDTMFAKAPEITLFNWSAMASDTVVKPGDRPWSGQPTTFDWAALQRSYKGNSGAGWARVAGYSLAEADAVVGQLGHPIGIAAYRPPHADGEDFLHDYLGNIGIPIELYPVFPTEGHTVLLTEGAKADPEIVAKMKAALHDGRTVVITSGLLKALQGKGIEDIVELENTGLVAPIRHFINGYGAGAGTSLDDADPARPPVLFPQIRFYTNDSWPIIRGVASRKGFPVMLMNRYSNGILYVLTVPENPGDLYNLPQPLLSQIRRYLSEGFPVTLDAPAEVALFAYDNDTFIVESYQATPTKVTIDVAGKLARLRDVTGGGAPVASAGGEGALPSQRGRAAPNAAPESRFTTTIAPHSFKLFKIER